jgi:serine/threonine protein kinase
MFPCPRCASPCDETHRFCFACGGELGETAKRPDDPLVGATLPGGYRVTHLVGVGGMGRVYCAEQVTLGRTVAVKVVHPHLAHDEMTAARFLNEARAASRLAHPNSVSIFDFGRTTDGHAYIVMEFLRGKDLSHVAHAEGPLSTKRIVGVLKQTLAALQEAHALGIVHRDLKPENIVLEPLRSGSDFVKVVDFGLAKILQADTPESGGRVLTRPGIVCGTPEYMSPEHARGDPLDGRSDLYALGVVLFELLTGQVPFSSDSPTKTLLMHLTEQPPDPRTVAPDRSISQAMADVVATTLAKSREERFQDAQALSDALERALAESEWRPSNEPPSTALRCRACGTVSAGGQKFCGECGAAIASAPPPRIDSAKPSASAGTSRTPPKPPPDSAVSSGPRGSAPTLAKQPALRARPGAFPLLGRDDALRWLDSRRHEASAVLATAHLVGEAGAGKTRLLAEFAARCAGRGDRVVLVGPDPSWAKVSDFTLRAAIAALAELPDEPTSEHWTGARAEARGGLELLFCTGTRSGTSLRPAERRAAVAEALRWALDRAAQRVGAGAALVLGIDDLDYVDGSSRNAFLDVLADPPICAALVVIAYARGPGTEPLREEAFSLGPLPIDAFSALLGGKMRPGQAALTPLHVEQLVAWVRETPEPPPASLADLVVRRTQRLSADARHALHALAVWGDDARPDVLADMLPPTADVGAALDALDKAGLVVVEERTLRVVHPLVRRVVASSIPAGLKRELYGRAAALRADAPLELRAKLAMHGGGALEALSLLDSASGLRAALGDLAGSVSALRHALDLARRELHRDDLDDPVAAVLVFARKLAEALSALSQWNDAEGVLREALGIAPPASGHRAHLLGVLAQVASSRSQPREARQYIDEALRVARQSNSRTLLPILERLDKAIAVA